MKANWARNRLVASTLFLGATKVAAIACALLVSVAVARALGPAEFGVYAFAMAVVGVVGLPVQLGLPTLIVRETARAETHSDYASMQGIWTWSTRLIIVNGLACAILAATAVYLFPDLLPQNKRYAIYWALPLIPLLALSGVRGAALRGLRRTVAGVMIDQVLRPLLFAGLVFSIWQRAAAEAPTASSALFLQTLATLAAFLVGVVVLVKVRPAELRNAKPEYRTKDWRRALVPLALISGMHLLLQSTDILMLSFFRNDEEVGLYRVAATGGTLAAFGLTAVNLIFQPYFARAQALARKNELQQLSRWAAVVCVSASLPVLALFWFCGEAIVSLIFGPSFVAAATPLLIVSIGKAVCSMFGPSETIIGMTGHEKAGAKFLAITVILNIGMNVALVPPFGMYGAAASSALSVSLWGFLFWRYVKNVIGVDCSILSVINRT